MRTLSNLIQLRKQLMELTRKTKLKETFAQVNAQLKKAKIQHLSAKNYTQ